MLEQRSPSRESSAVERGTWDVGRAKLFRFGWLASLLLIIKQRAVNSLRRFASQLQTLLPHSSPALALDRAFPSSSSRRCPDSFYFYIFHFGLSEVGGKLRKSKKTFLFKEITNNPFGIRSAEGRCGSRSRRKTNVSGKAKEMSVYYSWY